MEDRSFYKPWGIKPDFRMKAFLFQGTGLVVPESLGDEEAVYGVNLDSFAGAFGDLAFYECPGTGPEEDPILGLLLEGPLPPGWRTVAVRTAAAIPGKYFPEDRRAAARLFRAYHILQWRKESVYCGSCGTLNGDSPSELARLCPRCGRLEYPRISPAVIVLVLQGDGRVLLAHNKKFKDNVYSLIAGFAEAGENLEAAVSREIKEEVNIEVKNIRYITSQSWPFPNSLMAGFTASYAGGELRPDGEEITDARWFSREELAAATGEASREEPGSFPELPAPGSVSRLIISAWLAGDPRFFF